MLEKIEAANNEKWTCAPIRESAKAFLSEFFTHEIQPEGKLGCLAITSEMNAQRIVAAINATQLTTEQVKLPEKVPIKEGHISCQERENFNQLIDFCESLQARVKKLESGIIKREYGE